MGTALFTVGCRESAGRNCIHSRLQSLCQFRLSRNERLVDLDPHQDPNRKILECSSTRCILFVVVFRIRCRRVRGRPVVLERSSQIGQLSARRHILHVSHMSFGAWNSLCVKPHIMTVVMHSRPAFSSKALLDPFSCGCIATTYFL